MIILIPFFPLSLYRCFFNWAQLTGLFNIGVILCSSGTISGPDPPEVRPQVKLII